MSQLTFADFAARKALPEMTDEQWLTMCLAMEAIAASTLIEFESALAWGQWCRRKAAAALAEGSRSSPKRAAA